MKVITGIAGGRKLKSPSGSEIRPTADQVKQAVFNILQFDLEGRRVLDLFGGSGQLGIEALSRGATEAVFVDSSRKALSLIRENLDLCRLKGKLVQSDALNYLSRGERFDLIFVDPPYDAGLYLPVLQRINAVDNLNEGGIIICETRAETELPDLSAPYMRVKERRYGSVKICMYTRNANEYRI